MKKKTLLVLLIILLVCVIGILFLAIFDLFKEVELINSWKEDGVWEYIKDTRIPYLVRAIINTILSQVLFIGILFLLIFLNHREKLFLNKAETEELKKKNKNKENSKKSCS